MISTCSTSEQAEAVSKHRVAFKSDAAAAVIGERPLLHPYADRNQPLTRLVRAR